MKIKKNELDYDFIGGHDILTPSEEKALSDFLKQRKIKNKSSIGLKKIRSTKRIPVTVK